MEELLIKAKRSWRRMTAATIAFIAITACGIYCIEKGVSIEWFKSYTMAVVLLAFFAIGAIAATDVIAELRGK